MVISPRLASPNNFGKLTLPRRRHSDPKAPGNTSLVAENSQPIPDTSKISTPPFRLVMPNHAITRRGQLALQEYQTIQSDGDVELLSRIDIWV